jgi:hypothetical protein
MTNALQRLLLLLLLLLLLPRDANPSALCMPFLSGLQLTILLFRSPDVKGLACRWPCCQPPVVCCFLHRAQVCSSWDFCCPESSLR